MASVTHIAQVSVTKSSSIELHGTLPNESSAHSTRSIRKHVSIASAILMSLLVLFIDVRAPHGACSRSGALRVSNISVILHPIARVHTLVSFNRRHLAALIE